MGPEPLTLSLPVRGPLPPFAWYTTMLRFFLTLGLFLTIGFSSVSADISIANFTDATNDRFTDDPTFIGAGYDFSGVARTVGGGRWGTLISPNTMLTARHFASPIGSTFQFYPGNDPNATPFEAVVVDVQRVGFTDLSIAILDRNVDPSIAIYDFAKDEYSGPPPVTTTNDDGTSSTQTFFNVDPNEVDIVGDRILVFGVSPTDSSDVTTDQAIGENLVLGFSENVIFGSNTDNDSIILQKDAAGSNNFLTHETHVRGGDSGAPNFLIDSATNQLVLIGVNSFKLDGAAPSTFLSTGVTYTGNQVDEMNAIIEANAIVPTLLGDCNLDGNVNFLDITDFISFVTVSEYLAEADMNQDGSVNFLDITPFINLLTSL